MNMGKLPQLNVIYCLIELYKYTMQVISKWCFLSPANTGLPRGSLSRAVKPDDKSIYSEAIIKESESVKTVNNMVSMTYNFPELPLKCHTWSMAFNFIVSIKMFNTQQIEVKCVMFAPKWIKE